MIHPLIQWSNWVRQLVWKHARRQNRAPAIIRVRSSTLVVALYCDDLFAPDGTPFDWITLPPLDRQPWYEGRFHDGELPAIIAKCRRQVDNEPTLGQITLTIKRLYGLPE